LPRAFAEGRAGASLLSLKEEEEDLYRSASAPCGGTEGETGRLTGRRCEGKSAG
jgi:hypothetical protein